MLAPRSTAGSNRGPVQSAAPRVCAARAHPHTAERGLSNGQTLSRSTPRLRLRQAVSIRLSA